MTFSTSTIPVLASKCKFDLVMISSAYGDNDNGVELAGIRGRFRLVFVENQRRELCDAPQELTMESMRAKRRSIFFLEMNGQRKGCQYDTLHLDAVFGG